MVMGIVYFLNGCLAKQNIQFIAVNMKKGCSSSARFSLTGEIEFAGRWWTGTVHLLNGPLMPAPITCLS